MNRPTKTDACRMSFAILGMAFLTTSLSFATDIPVSDPFELRNDGGALIAHFDGFGNLVFDGEVEDDPGAGDLDDDDLIEELLIWNSKSTPAIIARLDPTEGANGTLFIDGTLFEKCGLDAEDCNGFPGMGARTPAAFETFRATTQGLPSLTIVNTLGDTVAWLDEDGDLFLWNGHRGADEFLDAGPANPDWLNTSEGPGADVDILFTDSLLDLGICGDGDRIQVWINGVEVLADETLGPPEVPGCTPGGETVEVTLKDADNWMVIRALDNGITGLCSVRVNISAPGGTSSQQQVLLDAATSEEIIMPIR